MTRDTSPCLESTRRQSWLWRMTIWIIPDWATLIRRVICLCLLLVISWDQQLVRSCTSTKLESYQIPRCTNPLYFLKLGKGFCTRISTANLWKKPLRFRILSPPTKVKLRWIFLQVLSASISTCKMSMTTKKITISIYIRSTNLSNCMEISRKQIILIMVRPSMSLVWGGEPRLQKIWELAPMTSHRLPQSHRWAVSKELDRLVNSLRTIRISMVLFWTTKESFQG